MGVDQLLRGERVPTVRNRVRATRRPEAGVRIGASAPRDGGGSERGGLEFRPRHPLQLLRRPLAALDSDHATR